MEYSVGRAGRIIAARLFEGEDLYESIEQLAKKENIKSAAVLITGGFRKANVVVGPKQETPKIVPNFHPFAGPTPDADVFSHDPQADPRPGLNDPQ